MCRMCGEKSESVGHLVSECSKLAQKEHKRKHDNVARIDSEHIALLLGTARILRRVLNT